MVKIVRPHRNRKYITAAQLQQTRGREFLNFTLMQIYAGSIMYRTFI